jgi:hypothetical protein
VVVGVHFRLGSRRSAEASETTELKLDFRPTNAFAQELFETKRCKRGTFIRAIYRRAMIVDS